MLYINDNNIYATSSYRVSQCVSSNTEYLPVCTYNDILLLSDGRLYEMTYDDKLSVLLFSKQDDYVVDSADFTDRFAKINSEYYEMRMRRLMKIPVIANNSHNIKKIGYEHHKYKYYYVNINNELAVFDALHKSAQCKILDDNVSLILILCHNSQNNHCIIYVKNNIIIYSDISNFTQLSNHYVIDYFGRSIIKSSDGLILDSHNDLYQLVRDDKKFILKKISDNVINFQCDSFHAYITDTESEIYRIGRYTYNRKYIGVGHFGKTFSNTKSANNTYKQI